jgi:hypothetical protein
MRPANACIKATNDRARRAARMARNGAGSRAISLALDVRPGSVAKIIARGETLLAMDAKNPDRT